MSKVIRNGRCEDDPFTEAVDGAALPGGPAVVSLKRFFAERESLLERNAPLGVRLKSEESPEALGGDVTRLALVVLEFPKFRDGRPFSWARMLRTRLHFQGEIRAAGDFLPDQLAYMVRVGFDAFEASNKITPETLAEALTEIRYVYQPSADGRATIGAMRARS